jgi:hypothetical protein
MYSKHPSDQPMKDFPEFAELSIIKPAWIA